MRKRSFFFVVFVFVAANAFAVNNYIPKKFNTVTSHSDTYPYVLNNTKTNTNAKDIAAATDRRSVVPRSKSSNARVAANTTSNNTQQRRVVQRSNKTARAATGNNTAMNARSAISPVRTRSVNTIRTTTTTYNTTNERPSSQRCMSDYKACMEDYCRREDTAYNRCYCSAKLAQIDAKYQNKIDELIQQIIRLKYNSNADSEEIREYWNKTVVGKLDDDNTWVNIDNALNIEWADTQSRINGQNAFNTGHQYCSQHLRACYYMASNLRDAYKSDIARDCEAYEKGLQKIQEAAESMIESYND